MLRVGMPDRPGALGAVASRIGAVRADVVGIEILTRADGRAMDEIVVEIDSDLLPLLLSEIAEVDGVVVEEVRMLPGPVRDTRLDAYTTAATLLEARSPDELLSLLASRVKNELNSGWVAVLDTESELMLAAEGRPPGADWLAKSFRRETSKKGRLNNGQAGKSGRAGKSGQPSELEQPSESKQPDGSDQGDKSRRADQSSGSNTEDVTWVLLARFDAVLAAGRPGWPFSEHDREQLEAMVRLAEARWSELSGKRTQPRTGEPRLIHP